LKWTRDVCFINNDEIVDVQADSVQIYDDALNPVERKPEHIDWDVEAAEKGGYKHFMLKEIFEQPNAVKETLCRRLDGEKRINLDGIKMPARFVKNIDKVYIVACGTAHHAGMVGKRIIEKLARIPCEVEVASEFRYMDPVITKKTLFIAISQSGETLDTLEALREAKKRGARVLSIVNVIGSSVARESDDVFYTWAGPEIAVASTKAYTTQLICVYLIALTLAVKADALPIAAYLEIIAELEALPKKLEALLKKSGDIEKLAAEINKYEQFFFIGRGLDVPTSYEASLKLKEISYINSFAIEAGELKHGTIALVNKKTVVFALATQGRLIEKSLSNAEEIMARKGHVVAVVKEKNKAFAKSVGGTKLTIPSCDDIVAPVLAVVPLQLLAYYIADIRGENIDKPKNLAKSVTVE
jgi:glucosamine--fructose-6-phosphate aminotransferase (isomerizing)